MTEAMAPTLGSRHVAWVLTTIAKSRLRYPYFYFKRVDMVVDKKDD